MDPHRARFSRGRRREDEQALRALADDAHEGRSPTRRSIPMMSAIFIWDRP